MNMQLGLGKADRTATPLHGMFAEVSHDSYLAAQDNQDEGRRAGFLALGMLLIAAAVISIRVPLMPTAVFIFGTALCFLQLYRRGLVFVENNRAAKTMLSVWHTIGAIPRGIRVALLLVIGLVSAVALAMLPRSIFLGELVINLLMLAGLILFVGPKSALTNRQALR